MYVWLTRRFVSVDDSDITLRMMGRLLERKGFSFDTAVDGQEAVDLIASGKKYCWCVTVRCGVMVSNSV